MLFGKLSKEKSRRSVVSIEFSLVGFVWLWVAWPFLQPGRFVYGFDTLSYSGPALKTTFDAWKGFGIPLWSEFMFGGVPFIGRLGAQALYFPNLPFSFFNLNTAMDLIMAAHLLFLGLGVLVLVRFGFCLAAPAGSISAITVLCSAFVGVKTLSLDQLVALAWLPWIFFFLEKTITAARPYKYSAGLSFSVSALVLGGHPQFIYLFLGLSSIFAIARVVDNRKWSALKALCVGGVATLGICSLQIYSTFSLNSSSVMAARKSLESLSNPAYVLPRDRIFQGVVGNPFSSNPVSVSGAGEAIAGIGVLMLTLGTVGFYKLWSSKQRFTAVTLFAIGIIAVPLSMGPNWLFFEYFYKWVPGFGNARVPGRLLVLTLVCLTLLAAFGIHFLIELARAKKKHVASASVVSLLTVAAMVLFHGSQSPLQWIFFISSATATVAFLVVTQIKFRQILGMSSIFVFVLIPAFSSQRNSPARLHQFPVSFDSYKNEIDNFLASEEGLVIALTYDRMNDPQYLVTSLRPNTNILHGIRLIDGYDGGMWVQKRWTEAMKEFTGGTFNKDLTVRSQIVFPINAEALSRVGVRWALIDTEVLDADAQLSGWVGPKMSTGTLQLWENPIWKGMVTVYHQSQGSEDNHQSIDKSLSQESISTLDDDSTSAYCLALCEYVAPKTSTSLGKIGYFETDLPNQSVAVIHVSWSKDWRVHVNGIESEIFPVNVNQVGVQLPPGLNEVTYQYMPRWAFPLLGLMIFSVFLSVSITLSSFYQRELNSE